jgi:superfamily II DNA or RNA helicase
MSLILRDYQEEAISLVMASWQEHQERLEKHLADVRFGLNPEPFVPGRELLVLATGAGKTCIFVEFARILAKQGILTLVLAHRDELLNQAAEKYRNIDPTAVVGKVAGSVNELGGTVTVASVATARNPKRLKQLQAFNFGLIVIDEGHHMAAAGYQTVLKAFPNAFVLIVTATPDRLDGKPIIDKPALYSKGIIDLVKAGHLCTPRAIAIRTDVSLDEIKTSMGDFNEKELSDAVDTPARNKRIVDAYVEHADGMPSIAFCVTVAHAQSLAYTFNDHGINAAVVTGETSADDRKVMYAQLRSGEIKILVSIQVLTEGFDEPCVSCIIMARPTKSRALYVQCVGRGARLFPGKNDFIVLDITDNCLKHRLTPHNLNKALNLKLKDNETIEEAEAREEEEREKEKQVRRLKDKRKEDLVVDLLQKFDWQKRESD